MNEFTVEHQKLGYLRYDVTVRYIGATGKKQLPIAWYTGGDPDQSSKPTSAIVRSSKAWGMKIVHFDMARMGALPIVPDMDPASSNEELLHYDIFTPAAIISPSAVPIYSVAGCYVFALLTPPTKATGFQLPRTLISRNGSPARLDSSKFTTYILGGSGKTDISGRFIIGP